MAMPAETTPHLITAEELLGLYLPGKSAELVRGHLVVREPPSPRHGAVAARLAYLLSDHVQRHRLGTVVVDAGFRIESDPDTVRAPDVAFIDRSRASQLPAAGYAPFAPDFAIEVVSPGDRAGELLAKVGQWLDAGTTLVWVVDPAQARASVYRDDGEVSIVVADGRLDGAPVLPGFTCSPADVLH
jgi:Uma2 family endonuclease